MVIVLNTSNAIGVPYNNVVLYHTHILLLYYVVKTQVQIL